MEKRTFGLSSLQGSVLGLGALHFGAYRNKAESLALIARADELGINFIDTAPMYGQGNSESFIGEALRGIRDRFILSTKVGLTPIIGSDGNFACEVLTLNKKNLARSIEASLMALQTDRIDLLQLHAFDATTPLEVTLDALATLQREGKVRFVGCSNYTLDQFDLMNRAMAEANAPNLVSFQGHFNMIERRAEKELLPTCHAAGSGFIVNRALARGLLSGQYQADKPLPENSRAALSLRIRKHLTPEMLALLQALKSIATEAGMDLGQLSLNWLARHPEVSVVLIGAQEISQLDSAAVGISSTVSSTVFEKVNEAIRCLGMKEKTESTPETFFET